MIPTLLDYLADAYGKELLRRAEQQHVNVVPDAGSLPGFLSFCETFLSKNRATQMGYAGDTYLITLTNGDQVLLCPTADGRFEPGDGKTAAANYIPVTGNETYQELRRSKLGEASHLKKLGDAQDMSQPQGPKRYDQ